MSKVLELKNLSYVYGTGTPFEKTAVNNLSLSIEKGEFIGIMGYWFGQVNTCSNAQRTYETNFGTGSS